MHHTFDMQETLHLESKVNHIYDYLYSNSPVRIPTAIAREASKVLRGLAHLETSNAKTLANAQSERDVATTIREAFRSSNKKNNFFEKDDGIGLSDTNIAYMSKKLSGIKITTTHRDVFGDAMEIFRSQWAKSNGGQFFTDQRVTRLSVKLLNFRPDKGDDFVDICAGTGGFLIAAINHIKESVGDSAKARTLSLRSIRGQEIDAELAAVANSTIAFQIGSLKAGVVNNADSLKRESYNAKASIQFDSHMCLATNPPFGTKITIRDSSILREFEIAKAHTRSGLFGEVSKLVNRAPDILFIEQNLRLLKPGVGRLAIVVPYQIVSGPQTLFVRQWILRNAEILAVVDLPAETFQPHTGTKATLLVLKRRKHPLKTLDLSSDCPIFMSTPRWIGHDRRGNPTYKRNADGTISDEILSDFLDVESDFLSFKKDHVVTDSEISFSIAANVLLEDSNLRLDARFYRSHKANGGKIISDKQFDYVKVKDVAERIFYPGRFSRNYVSDTQDSIPFLGGTNILQLLLRTEKRISSIGANVEELRVKKGWVLITRSGSVGIVSTVPKSWEGHAFSEHVIRIVPNEKKIPAEYIFAFLKTKYAQEIIARGVYGSVIDEITPEYIGELEIPVPKNKKLLDQIVKDIKDGEAAREKAIGKLSNGIQALEAMFK